MQLPINTKMDALDQWVSFMSKYTEKDNVMKFFMSGSTVYAEYSGASNADDIRKMGGAVAFHRCMFLFGGEMNFIRNAIKQLQNITDGKGDAVTSAISMSRFLALAGFYIHQQICWLHRVGALGPDKMKATAWKHLQIRGMTCWFVASLLGLANMLRNRLTKGVPDTNKQKLNELKMCCDTVTSGFNSTYLSDHVSKGQSGITGVTSAAIGIYYMLQNHSKK
jgi:hypothetical protein